MGDGTDESTVLESIEPATVTASFETPPTDVRELLSGQQGSDTATKQLTAHGSG